MNPRNLIPRFLKIQYKRCIRHYKDMIRKTAFAHTRSSKERFEYSISETQQIKQSSYFQNKVDNIRLGAKLIEQYVIAQGETFSFWYAVGKPSPAKGFKIGRNLINGTLQSDYGGGLCQLSGIIYLTALKAGITVTERHNHSIDIYSEEERFAPLGSDATIVYGYKDLRIVNPYPFEIRFCFEIQDQYISCYLQSPEQISELKIEFKRKNYDQKVLVHTFANDVHLTDSEYLKP